MYTTLLTIAIFLGVFALGSIMTLLWVVKRAENNKSDTESPQDTISHWQQVLFRWTYFDYALVLLFMCSMLFLAADLAAVLRDREAYPFYHYGYLASGFIFSLVSMLFMLIRLGMVLSMGSPLSNRLTNDHEHPTEANQPEHGVQG
jgi:hypothetical protein